MTYDTLTATTKLSELAAILNGVTTRRTDLQLTGSETAGIVTKTVGYAHGMAIAELIRTGWLLPPRLDRAVDATLHLWGAPATSEASVQISMDVALLSLDPTAGTLINAAATGTLQLVDQAVSGTLGTLEEFTLAIAAATYFTDPDVDRLAIEIERVTATTDLVGEWELVAAAIEWTIER